MWILLVLAGAVLAVVALRVLLVTPPGDLARMLRRGGAGALVILGLGLIYFRRYGLAMPLILAGVMAFRRGGFGSPRARSGQKSNVRTAGLDMVLDHDSGIMDGLVLAGRHEGKRLSQLTQSELLEVAEDFRGDVDSLRLLEGHLDRAHPGWRDHIHNDDAGRTGPAPRPGRMSAEEAYQILGLKPGAGETEVRKAHRRLMKQVHPDRGGSAALAAQINEAKDRILGAHR